MDAVSNASNMTGGGGPGGGPPPFAGPASITLLSILFTAIFIVGIIGNMLVVFVILVDRKMRNSATNILILNMAVADFFVTLMGIPEIIQFMMDRGWLLGLPLCRFNRYFMTANLFSSIMSLVSVCVERYIAIVHPIKAHILCEKKKVLMAIAVIWPLSFLAPIYSLLYNNLVHPAPHVPIQICVTELPGDNFQLGDRTRQKYVQFYEMIVFYMVPVALQIVLYTIISLKLFRGHHELHAQTSLQNGGNKAQQGSEALKARRGVVLMLISCVVVYVISYSPVQFLLIYNTAAKKHIGHTWELHVFVMVMAQVNSAANPILYCIISQKFRRCFQKYLCAVCTRVRDYRYEKTTMDSFDSRVSGRRTTLTKTLTSTV